MVVRAYVPVPLHFGIHHIYDMSLYYIATTCKNCAAYILRHIFLLSLRVTAAAAQSTRSALLVIRLLFWFRIYHVSALLVMAGKKL